MILPCSVQNFKTIRLFKQMFWMNKFLRNLNLRWVPDGYGIGVVLLPLTPLIYWAFAPCSMPLYWGTSASSDQVNVSHLYIGAGGTALMPLKGKHKNNLNGRSVRCREIKLSTYVLLLETSEIKALNSLWYWRSSLARNQKYSLCFVVWDISELNSLLPHVPSNK